MSHSNISPLRQRMIEDMTLRKLGPSTQTGYIRAVVKLTRYLLGETPQTHRTKKQPLIWSGDALTSALMMSSFPRNRSLTCSATRL